MRSSRVGSRVPYGRPSRSNTRVEWLGGERRQGGIVGVARAVWPFLVGVWRWVLWIYLILVAPFVLIPYWGIMVALFGVFWLVFLCMGKPKATLEMIKVVSLVPPNIRRLLVPPRTRLLSRAFRVVTRWW